ncbi:MULTISPECIES: hypothetical protein [Xanthomonas]|uniref:hypothetical protein n=1 Tax=Xanthomonas TaxID=338 RepID=UPI0009D07793|nr:hypothetical protein [Xanthomonas perforans]MCC8548336.1 hypothetical protein [Xanthomonas perforans]MCC8562303.1 hypothetical protein [Xanthomonas perforans]MDC9654645.1 hypothetical protein [Xanthomonas perforans]MDC9658882.1 hypothetical protein [Xanthomonas perforans]MDC9679788.1 hypothetical protein [Xanthomonas perforans]
MDLPPQDERSHAPPGGRLALALPALLAACVAAGALAAPPSGGSWATIAGYYPGMGKEAARKVGLANCKAAYEAVECKALAALTFAGAVSRDSDITLNEKTERIESVEFQFSKEAYPSVVAALVAQLGEPTATDDDARADAWRRAGRSSCDPVLIWQRGGDDVVAVCGGGWHRNGRTYLVADRKAGRGKEWAEIVGDRAKSRRAAEAFNSK